MREDTAIYWNLTCIVQLVRRSSSLRSQHQVDALGVCLQLLQHLYLQISLNKPVLGRIEALIPLPVRLPPKPPAPRMKTVIWFSKMILPVAMSFVYTMVVTEAALPLSKTSNSLCSEIGEWRNNNTNIDKPSFINKVPLCRYRALDSQELFAVKKLSLKRMIKFQEYIEINGVSQD